MPCDLNLVLASARSQIGYMEKETWDQLDDFTANAGDENFVKYSRDLAKFNYFNGTKKGVAWCAIFTAWNYVQTYGIKAARKLLCQPTKDNCGAGCNSAMNYFKNKGRFFTTPQPGDVIFFWNAEKKEASHTGHVEKVSSTYVYTIEGNTSGGSGIVANGGTVAAKKYKLTNDRIAGYGRPDYESIDPDPGYEVDNQIEDKEEAKEETAMVTGTAWVSVKKGSTVNYRQSPSASAKKVVGCNTIKQGEEVYIKTSDGTWAAVEYKGFRGYVMMEFLTTENPNGSVDTELPSGDTQSRSGEQIIAEITALLKELSEKIK